MDTIVAPLDIELQERRVAGLRLSHEEYQGRRYMAALDGMRALAVIIVISVHLHERMWSFLNGNNGVIIFFVLSGYLITRLMLKEEEKTGKVHILSFYIRRTFRIFPLYYFVLAIYAVLILGLHISGEKAQVFKQVLPYYLTYFQEVGIAKFAGQGAPFYQTWSLGIEEKFYLLFPFLMIGLARSRRDLRIAIVSACAVLCMLPLFRFHDSYRVESYGFIFLGVLLALLLSRKATYEGFMRLIGPLCGFALCVAVVLQFSLVPMARWNHMGIPFACAVTILMGGLVSSRGLADRLLSWQPLVFVGKMSYAIYLVHILCLGVVEHIAKPGHGPATGMLAYAGTLLVSTAVAYVLHLTVERPMMRVGRGLSERFLVSR